MSLSTKTISLTVLSFVSLPTAALASDPISDAPLPAASSWSFGSGAHSTGRPDSHAPIGVMADHVHKAGEWMVSLRYMRMEMEGSRDGTNGLSDQQVLSQGFMVTPTDMTMEMWMLGGMYAPSDSVTLMAMVPYLRNTMNHLTGMGGTFETSSEGLGDVRLSALIPVTDESEATQVHFEAGVSLPTGSTDERGATPMSANAKLPYPMQLGSGTFDLIVGATAQQQFDSASVGAQLRATFRTGENDDDYTLGDRLEATGWWSQQINESNSLSLRLAYSDWNDIDGADPEFAMAAANNVVPTVRTDLRAGKRLDAGLGINSQVGSGWRLAAEVLVPVHQDLDGPQLETDLIYVLGAQLSF